MVADSGHLIEQLDTVLHGWQPDFVGTLAFIIRGESVLLIRKKRGHGAGKLNGPGGKVEPGETPLECVVRETEEEVGVRLIAPQRLGRFRFVDLSDPQWLGYAFLAESWERETH